MLAKSYLRPQASRLQLWRTVLVSLLLAAAATCNAFAGAVSGTVKDPVGAAFRGAFVRARNQQTKMTVNVLSDALGRYRLQNLPSGDYEIRATATGYDEGAHSVVKVA